MKAQTRRGAALESSVNLVIGFSLAWGINYCLLNRIHLPPTAGTLLLAGLLVTVASVVRSYWLRRLFEWLRIRKAPPDFLYIVEDLAAERLRQINGEGYSLDHDDRYVMGELEMGAAAYAMAASFETPENRAHFITGWPDGTIHPLTGEALPTAGQVWPFEGIYFRPTTPRRDLEKAGAMIIAAIGRMDRRQGRSS